VLRDKGLEEDEEVVPWDVVFELICCPCATAVVDDSINRFNKIGIIATVNTMAVPNADCFVIGQLRIIHPY